MLQFNTPTRATRFERTARVVEPYVATVQHLPGDGHVVVLQEDDAMADLELAGEDLELADHVLAGLIRRMRFAGEHDLHRAIGIEQQPPQSLGLGEQQGRSLVRGEAARETDRQRVGVEHVLTEM
jgi:hypothetical protein